MAVPLAVPVRLRGYGGGGEGKKEEGNASIAQESTTVTQFLQPPSGSNNALENQKVLVKTVLLIISLWNPLVILTSVGSFSHF